MRDARYFLDQAERCFRLARASNDRERTGRLESMAAEFIGKAVELRATLEPAATPVTVKAKPSSR